MAITITLNEHTQKANFIKNLQRFISNGSSSTWCVDSEGDFTHTPQQWRNRAWFRLRKDLSPRSRTVCFGIISSKTYRFTKEIYAIYHGRFAEMLLAHFDDDIANISLSSQMDAMIDFI